MTWLSTAESSRDCHLALTYICLDRNTESTLAMPFLSLSLFILIDWLCFQRALSEIRDSSCFIEHGRSPCEKLELTFFSSSSSSKWVAGIPFSHSMLLAWERWIFLLSWLLHRSSGKALVWGSRLIFPKENIISWRCPDMHWSRVGKKESIEISRCFVFLFVVFNSDQWRTKIILLLLSLLEILDDSARMCLLLSSSLVLFLWNLCLAIAVNHDQQQVENLLVSHERFDQCKSVGNFCETNNDCCSSLICYAIQGRTSLSLAAVLILFPVGLNLCLPSTIDSQFKRQTDDLIIPPYYNPSQQLYPYGISQPGLPFYKGHESKQSSEGKKLGNDDRERWLRLSSSSSFV